MEKRWNISLTEGPNEYRARGYYLHGSETWNLVLQINGITETAMQTDNPTADALSLIAEAQAEAHEAAFHEAQGTKLAA